MKVTIIYDSIEANPIRIVMFDGKVRYFGEQCFGRVPHKLRGFDSLEEAYEWATNNDEYCRVVSDTAYDKKYAFYDECSFRVWINTLCDDYDSLSEIYIKH